jgi:hypothetical protein
MVKQTRLSVVQEPTTPAPPGHLDEFGMALWQEVTSTFEFADRGSIEILYQACCCRSRAERCRRIIDEVGEVVQSRTGPKPNALLRDELQNRMAAARLLGKLGMDLVELHPGPGRPPGG